MSQTDLQRFADAIRTTPDLLERYAGLAGPAEVAAQLRADGYDVSGDEVEAGMSRGRELSDEQLDQVSGGSILATAAIGVAVGAGALFAAGVAGTWIWAVATIAQGAGQSAPATPDPRSYRIGWRS
ncbi:Nif11-like leader peptide family RiPP precursor [Azospirillum agricola]|uniref:Nif11-like leader peptide family RiPP precursor n=1 Tax=Azospirillum agricola TaxID=1720247 RepID=UPI000A0F3A28|nr:Nif11-like leader peptide family RiPP precursor [Azospirillum agricola]SMH28695.1 nif11-like leader peptide domain-containing protein [Azospirillum lipoferum]